MGVPSILSWLPTILAVIPFGRTPELTVALVAPPPNVYTTADNELKTQTVSFGLPCVMAIVGSVQGDKEQEEADR